MKRRGRADLDASGQDVDGSGGGSSDTPELWGGGGGARDTTRSVEDARETLLARQAWYG